MKVLQDAAGEISCIVAEAMCIVAEAILDNPVAFLAIGSAVLGYGVYSAGRALVEVTVPLVQDAADYVGSAYSSAADEVTSWIAPAQPAPIVALAPGAPSNDERRGRVIEIRAGAGD